MGTDEVGRIKMGSDVGETEAVRQRRERSTIEFPYSDLGSAIEIARVINERAGLECEATQLAAWLGQSVTGGTFRSRYSAARLFGLIETERGGHVKLTTLGLEALSPQKSDKAKSQAFLKVELFRQMYETYKGNALPPAAALERMVTNLGVAPKQAERARQTFTKSADVAQFIDQQTGAFIEPAFPSPTEPAPAEPSATVDSSSRNTGGGGGDDGDVPPELDPIIKGLIGRLPRVGSVWPSEQRKLWLGILENTFQLVYRDDEMRDRPETPQATEDIF